MKPVAILGSGMVTGVGLESASSCAAIRCAVNNFIETRFADKEGERIVGSPVPLDPALNGFDKLLFLAASAIKECLMLTRGTRSQDIPLLVGIAEKTRPGRPEEMDSGVIAALEAALGVRFSDRSQVFEESHVSGARAMERAAELIHVEKAPFCIVAGVDTFLTADTLSAFDQRTRLLTPANSDGFIPGEAGAAVVLGRPGKTPGPQLVCAAIGFGEEPSVPGSTVPLRADGLVEALRAAFKDGGLTYDDVDYRISGLNGEQAFFKEASLALTRTLHKPKPVFDLWHPSDCVGEIGAAIVPCILSVALAAARKAYAPGKGVLCQFGNDAGTRSALILRYEGGS
jgi:3-oxoacyl-[acyl-carrier-protein] synthase-1